MADDNPIVTEAERAQQRVDARQVGKHAPAADDEDQDRKSERQAGATSRGIYGADARGMAANRTQAQDTKNTLDDPSDQAETTEPR